MADEFVDYYSLLRIEPTATTEEIDRAYHLEIRYWHPDNYHGRAPRLAEEAEQRARLLNDAQVILSNPDARALYDGLYSEWRQVEAQKRAMNADSEENSQKGPYSDSGGSSRATEIPGQEVGPKVLHLELSLKRSSAPKSESRAPLIAILRRSRPELQPAVQVLSANIRVVRDLATSIRVVQTQTQLTLHVFVYKEGRTFPIAAEVGATFTTGGAA